MKTLILSDLHLGAAGPYATFESAAELVSLLTTLTAEGPLHVFLNGDAFDFLLDASREPPKDLGAVLAHARAIADDNAAVLQAFGRVLDQGALTIRLGNHDVELALAEVQGVLRAAMVGDTPARAERLSFVRGDWPSFVRVGEATLLVTHGEHKDAVNRVRYTKLPGPGGPEGAAWADFPFPPGSMLVRRGLNPLKEKGLRFADLVKPDFQGGFFSAAAVDPRAVQQVLADSGLAVGLACVRASFYPRTFQEDEERTPVDLGLTEALRAMALTDGELAALDQGLGGYEAGRPGVRAAAKALRRLARLHRWVAGEQGERFFSLEPTDDEWREARRLARKFDAAAVLVGHSHAARWGAADGVVYANTGTWIPLVELPPALDDDENDEENLRLWERFLQELRQDREMTGKAAGYLRHVRTFVQAEPSPAGARLSLCEWRDGAVHVMKREDQPCQAEISARTPKGERPRPRRAPTEVQGRVWSLLADEQGRPWLPEGLPLSRIDPGSAPRPEDQPTHDISGKAFVVQGADQNALFQGWGIVVPAGQRARVDWIRPLYEHRASQPELAGFVQIWELLRRRGDPRSQSTDEPLPIFEVDASETATPAGALAWARQNTRALRKELGALDGERALPLYLLLLGDLHEIPVTIEQALGGEGLLPGRLAFSRTDGQPDVDGYRAYAAKLVRYERAPLMDSKAPALFYAPMGDTGAVAAGEHGVLEPAFQHLSGLAAGRCPFSRVRRIDDDFLPDPSALLDDPDVQRASALLTISHGLPAAHKGEGWQRRRQGAMSFGFDAEPLTADLLAEHLRTRPFLPGGAWFYIACFGAGTPTASAYAPWLRRLEAGGVPLVAEALQGLSLGRAFVAALPQVALAHPNGPLTVIGHVDLAWTYGMQDHEAGASKASGRFAGHRFARVMSALGTSRPAEDETGVWGLGRGGPQRVGVAFDRLVQSRRVFASDLASLASPEVDSAARALAWPEAWLCYQDIGGYITLGDPAACLPLREPRAARAEASPAPRGVTPPVSPPPQVHEIDALVALARAELVEGKPGLGARYSEGGRAALARAGASDPDAVERALLALWRGDEVTGSVPRVLLDALTPFYERGGREAVASLVASQSPTEGVVQTTP